MTNRHATPRRLFLLMALAACGDLGPVSVVVAPESAKLLVGEIQLFTASVVATSGDTTRPEAVTWESTDTTVVAVSPIGVATATGGGRADLRARTHNASATARLIVVGPTNGGWVGSVGDTRVLVNMTEGSTGSITGFGSITGPVVSGFVTASGSRSRFGVRLTLAVSSGENVLLAGELLDHITLRATLSGAGLPGDSITLARTGHAQ